MANGDGVVSDQDVFHYKPHDSLALKNTQCISSTVQAGEERREGLRQAQEDGPIVGLVSDCLQLSTERLFTLMSSVDSLILFAFEIRLFNLTPVTSTS